MPGRTALEVTGQGLTYGALRERATSLAATLQQRVRDSRPAMTAVFADRSVTAFAGILGSLLAGHAYVPLNPYFPTSRTRTMLALAGCRSLIVDAVAERQLDEILDGNEVGLLVILPDRVDTTSLSSCWPQHAFVGQHDLEPPSVWRSHAQSPDDLAYLLFTSGSTGVPKGVMVTHANGVHLVRTMAERYAIVADDRFSQLFDITFDLSVFDMFVAWERGACLCCPSRKTLLNPDGFVRDKGLTIWFSVPSVAMLMDRFGVLRPDRYPSIRWSLFCGERLPVDVATRWCAAAPHSTLENLYGPTELTVACTAYRWNRDSSPADSQLGVVPIGSPLPGMRARIVDEDTLTEVLPGAIGELLMTGPQLTAGYWKNFPATTHAYVRVPDDDALFYRTGDRVRRPIGGGPMTFHGRADQQVKIRGHRVELEEVESKLLESPGITSAVALGWPTTAAGAAGVVAFVTGAADVDLPALRLSLESKLHTYAVPQTIHVLPQLPHNSNGKVDRRALLRLLDA